MDGASKPVDAFAIDRQGPLTWDADLCGADLPDMDVEANLMSIETRIVSDAAFLRAAGATTPPFGRTIMGLPLKSTHSVPAKRS